MKDKQIAPAAAEPRIFLISALLHCVSMIALVYLRSSFGFSYLRPKSIFLALSWAFLLYAIYAWIDGGAWAQHRAVLFFGAGAIFLYWFHLLIAIVREWNQLGAHDQYSGTSHPLWLMRWTGHTATPQFEATLHLWAEPLAILTFSLVLRFVCQESTLPLCLGIVATCLWCKEALNQWHRIRQKKRRQDVFEDTEEIVEPPSTSNLAVGPPKATRKTKVKRSRNIDSKGSEAAKECKLAEVLRLMPPYTLQQAEANYRELVKHEHPDTQGGSEENNARAAQLNEAIKYFRSR